MIKVKVNLLPDNMFMFHHGCMGKHLVHRHLLVVTVHPDSFLANLDGVNDSIKTVPSFLNLAELTRGDLF